MKRADFFATRAERRRIALAAQQVGEIGAGRIGFDVGELVAPVRALKTARGGGLRGQARREGQGLFVPSNQLKSMTGEIITIPPTPTPS